MKTKLSLCALFICALAARRLEAQPAVQFATIYQFGGVNAIPSAELTLGPSGHLFGTTYGGADADGTGSIYELVPNGNGTFTFNTLYRFDTSGSPANDGQYPYAGLTLSPDGTSLYGTTQQGGSGSGVIFSLNIAQSEGALLKSGLPQPKGGSGSPAGYNDLYPFSGATDGGAPHGALAIVSDETVQQVLCFGTCSSDGPDNGGAIFLFEPKSAEEQNIANRLLLASYSDWSYPEGSLVVVGNNTAKNAPNSKVKSNAVTNIDLSIYTLYGITKSGGSNNWGTVYRVNGNGSNFMVLHHFNFSASDGAGPMGGMVLSGNTLYGTTPLGGNNYAGTIFKINTDGSGFQIIENFDFATTGYSPQGDLILSGDTLYGTTHSGGVNGGGTVYSINTSGSNFMVLHSFTTPISDGNGHYTNSDGGLSVAGLLLSHYTLYGTTPYGGTNGVGTAYEIMLPAPPSLSIAKPAGNYAIAWPSSATNFVLQSNSTLNSLTWSNFTGTVHDDGTNRSIGIIPKTGNAFFRLLNTNGP